MRVISGSAKGRRLRVPQRAGTRPTTDRIRQVIFDLLGEEVRGARTLDLFAGSGAMGIEALSRGAAEATFVEARREACDVILQNLEATGLRGSATIRRGDVLRILGGRPGDGFDLAFVDPPYERGLAFTVRVLGRLAAGWVRPGAAVVVEVAGGAPEWPAGFHETRARRFGRTHIFVVRYSDAG